MVPRLPGDPAASRANPGPGSAVHFRLSAGALSLVTSPLAAKKPVTSTVHGVTLTDDYAWLRADNWQEVMRDPTLLSQEIRDYLEAENAHTATSMAETD
ncbi:MAG: S9 family peptidase, partial [Rhizobiales bacterium]|nr:S9 family peptidase [Hyphomicrobiales bacterium]